MNFEKIKQNAIAFCKMAFEGNPLKAIELYTSK